MDLRDEIFDFTAIKRANTSCKLFDDATQENAILSIVVLPCLEANRYRTVDHVETLVTSYFTFVLPVLAANAS